MPPETRYARHGDDHIAYQVVGDGPIDMVFMSAWFSHVDGRWEEPLFARMLRRFASFSRLIVFDKRGSGASDPLSAEGTTWEDWADDILAVMDDAKSERAFVVGVGDSGPMAMLFAATHPERVNGIVVVNSAARLTRSPDHPWGLTDEEVKEFLAEKERTWGRGGLLEYFSPSKLSDDQYREWWAKYQRMSASPRPSGAMAKLIFGIDVRDILSTIQVPTLVIHRNNFRLSPVEQGRYLSENIPNAKYVELEGSDGFIYLGDSEPIFAEIEEFVTGARHAAEPDRVLATVVFTDIVQSTDKAAAMGDRRWRQLLDEHDEVVSRHLDKYRGRLVKTTGDGLLATFDGPARAIYGAGAIRDDLRKIGIDIRSGLHTGEVEVRGDDVGGIGVHIGARVMSVAKAGQLVVSSTVKDLVAGSGINFADLGPHTLKGVPDEWRLFEVLA